MAARGAGAGAGAVGRGAAAGPMAIIAPRCAGGIGAAARPTGAGAGVTAGAGFAASRSATVPVIFGSPPSSKANHLGCTR